MLQSLLNGTTALKHHAGSLARRVAATWVRAGHQARLLSRTKETSLEGTRWPLERERPYFKSVSIPHGMRVHSMPWVLPAHLLPHLHLAFPRLLAYPRLRKETPYRFTRTESCRMSSKRCKHHSRVKGLARSIHFEAN